MKKHIVEKDLVKISDELYYTGWEMIARHYHKPTGQWSGPQSRTYRTFATPHFYRVMQQATGGRMDFGQGQTSSTIKIKHVLPEGLFPYFSEPQYPRVEKRSFREKGTHH